MSDDFYDKFYKFKFLGFRFIDKEEAIVLFLLFGMAVSMVVFSFWGLIEAIIGVYNG